jgi:hypothetical protein
VLRGLRRVQEMRREDWGNARVEDIRQEAFSASLHRTLSEKHLASNPATSPVGGLRLRALGTDSAPIEDQPQQNRSRGACNQLQFEA